MSIIVLVILSSNICMWVTAEYQTFVLESSNRRILTDYISQTDVADVDFK